MPRRLLSAVWAVLLAGCAAHPARPHYHVRCVRSYPITTTTVILAGKVMVPVITSTIICVQHDSTLVSAHS